METEVELAYAARAVEYVSLFDSMDSVHPSDRQVVTDWATQRDGPLIDAGCGPGQWTNYLSGLGCDVRGIDLTSGFIEHARKTYPDRRFDVGTLTALDTEDRSVAGVLSWYSLIHQEPGNVQDCLVEFARVIRTGGGLLVGFFEGPSVESFDHAVVTAYRWPLPVIAELVGLAGFEVIETYTRTEPEHRPHGAISAIRQ
ncbi:class I SAM-dependent methyltransferase [Rhodococcus sp. G-MC3]|uniref:class I SAM-dependent methyltransferase n=1 Tax=Rhodococcus sp. G-MC3 TaxID=3046209 RepID=UPI0024B9CAEB|nr:class I SAM-dependent methyltransferase [Rhodococcus sp. G-MC3]MDJ0396373.1 class I SAM-dependent methyltransferase [Rhodococcus sp. G-MC3]